MRLHITLAALVVQVLALPVHAADMFPTKANPVPPRVDEAWRAQVTAYAWATGISGYVKPLATGPITPTVRIDKSFGDLLSDLDGAVFAHGTLRYGRLVLLGDFTWARVSEQRSGTVLGFGVSAGATVTQTSATLMAGYTVVQQPSLAVDVLGGTRIFAIKASAFATLPIFGAISQSVSESWVDPIVGARLRANISPRWSVIVYGDYGGFGVGSESTWQLVGTLNYQATRNLFLSAGYRYMAFDYRSDGRILDINMYGPLLGATWRF